MFPQEIIDIIILLLPIEQINENRHLLSKYANHVSKYTTFEDAVKNNANAIHFDWLWNRSVEFKTRSMFDWVASTGNVKCIEWITVRNIQGCTANAMDRAARNGHLDVVKWLDSKLLEP